MERRIEDVQYCERLFQSFYDIGSTSQGGVTRLGYSETEDTMHERSLRGLEGSSGLL